MIRNIFTIKMSIALVISFAMVLNVFASDLLIEAENFSHKGGWVVDQQFMDLMGSPYLMAHGMGVPVEDASTEVSFREKGTYYVYVRTFNWTSPWYQGAGPGKFSLYVDGKRVSSNLGTTGNKWMWQLAGKVNVRHLNTHIRLHDLTGFNGRCDAIYFSKDKNSLPPSHSDELVAFRKQKLQIPDQPTWQAKYDFVVVGAGIAGMSAAVSAARLGCKVALVNDRPVIGGNNSSEIRVHLGGRIETGLYKELGGLQKEFGPSRGGNAKPAEYYEDEKKMNWILKEKNVDLFTNYRAVAVETKGASIVAVIAQHIETGEEKRFEAPLFSDCTGDGTIGYLAGADYRMGREGRDEFHELRAPEKSDSLIMGASVQWYSNPIAKAASFPEFKYGLEFDEKTCERVTMGEWTWETGMNLDQIKDFERIRDYGLLVVYTNWSFLKNELKENHEYRNRKLGWVAYVSGKRESRRLMGDYILKETDIRRNVVFEDATGATTWTMDLHYPDPRNIKNFPGNEFKSISRHVKFYPYPVPYRCLYSRNIDNLFMAGRNISVTHVALGTVRVMRTCGVLGEVVGMAASLCKKYGVKPRSIYRTYFSDLQTMMKVGVGGVGYPNNQTYNLGGTLEKLPEFE